MQRTRFTVAALAWTIAMASDGRDAAAQFSGGSAFSQLTLDVPDTVLQGTFSVSFPSTPYTVPGTAAVITTQASVASSIMPTVAGIDAEMQVSFTGSPGGNGFGLEDQALAYLNATPSSPPPNVNYLYYAVAGFKIDGNVAPGDTLQFTTSEGIYGGDSTLLGYSNTFGPGAFSAAGGKTEFLGNYFQLGEGATDLSLTINLFIDRGAGSGSNETYINIDPTLSVYVSSVPEPSSAWLLGIGAAVVCLWLLVRRRRLTRAPDATFGGRQNCCSQVARTFS